MNFISNHLSAAVKFSLFTYLVIFLPAIPVSANSNKEEPNQVPATLDSSDQLVQEELEEELDLESGEIGEIVEVEVEEEVLECDPVVNLTANNQKRSQILRDLATEYGFKLKFQESEDESITTEQNRPLSGVIKSVTRGLNVINSYQRIGDCDVLVELAVLQSKPEAGSSSFTYTPEASVPLPGEGEAGKGKKRNKSKRKSEGASANYADREERRNKRKEKKGKKADRLGEEEDLEPIGDMELYVQEVMDGTRKYNKRALSREQRAEYKAIKKRIRREQKEARNQ